MKDFCLTLFRFFARGFCVALCVYVFLVLSAERSSALTQAEVTAAMVQALQQYATATTGDPTILAYTVPLTDETDAMYLASLLTRTTTPGDISTSITQILYDYIATRWWPYIQYLQNLPAIKTASESLLSQVQSFQGDFSIFKDDWDVYSSFVLSDLSNLLSALGSVSSSLSASERILQGIDSRLSALSHASSNNNEQVLQALDDLYGSLGSLSGTMTQIYDYTEYISENVEDAAGYLYEIEQHTEDTAGATGGIFDWLRYEYYDILVEAQAALVANLPDLYHVWVENTNAIPDTISVGNWPDTLTDAGWFDDVRSLNQQQYNTQTEIRDWLTNLVLAATNFYAQMIPTESQVGVYIAETNSIQTNLVFTAADDQAGFEAESNKLEAIEMDFSDRLNTNPYDAGDGFFGGLEQRASAFLDVDPETTRYLVLSAGNSVVQVGHQRVRLPRIEIDLQQTLESTGKYSWLTSLTRGLWYAVAFFVKMILLVRFSKWFSSHRK